MKISTFFLSAIVGGVIFTGLFVSMYVRASLEPNISINPNERIGLYAGAMYTFRRQTYTDSAKNFEIRIEQFSKELQLATLSGEPIKAQSYLRPITWDAEAQFADWGFKVRVPQSILPGEYEIRLLIITTNWFFSYEDPLRIVVTVEPAPTK